ncbi:MAG: ATP-dependent DNA helicase RecG [Treponema sp.]|nr:ATP-dependent DNA helicase RecG [Treponema sp.]
MKLEQIKTPVSAVSGVGPQLSKSLARLNIFTVGDLLNHFPKDYDDKSKKVYLKDFAKAKKVHTVAKVLGHEWFGFGKMRTLKIIINDGTATAQLICFNRQFLEKMILPGMIVNVSGQFFVKYNSLQSSSFDVSKFKQNVACDDLKQLIELMPEDSSVLPVYRLTEGVTQKQMSKIIKNAINQYGHGIEDEIPSEFISKYKLVSKQQAISMIHNPETLEEAFAARRTLAYEELLKFQYAILKRSYKRRGVIPSKILEFDENGNVVYEQKKQTYNGNNVENQKTENQNDVKTAKEITKAEFVESLSPLQKKLIEKIPFDLTQDQMNVIFQMDEEIDQGYLERNKIAISEAESESASVEKNFVHTMNRLLQGDVGSGKTLVALFVCLRAISWKGQCAFMAPTEILAKQHADKIAKMLECLGVRTAFLTGNVKSSGRNQLLKALKDGEIDIIIGTHALFSANVVYNDLQLAVIDEQHRFGVAQRQAILAKGRKSENNVILEPHVLMMSATPIPQSLALTMFSDLDISVMKTMPSNRKPVITYLVKEGNEKNAYEAVRKELKKGNQAYFVYPAIENEFESFDDEALDGEKSSFEYSDDDVISTRRLKSAEKNFKHLAETVFPEFKCALVHGRIDEEEQSKILNDFHSGKIQVLVATTVIEVGVDNPRATCMVIEQADHFGMSQLHQLRGRVGRGSEQSYCFMIYSKNITESGIERMKALRLSNDGFYIAEQDLKNRGPGEMNGTLQSGALEFKIADVSRDKKMLLAARNDAISMLLKC